MQRKISTLAFIAAILPASFSDLPIPQEKVTYERNVEPIVRKFCLPCHLADSENPSGLALDSYQTLRMGGENGDPIEPRKPDESLFYLKLQDPPPFGRKMPRDRKRISDEEIALIQRWIEQGAHKE